MESLICRFIREHKDWRELLASEPYCLKLREKGDYTLFKYNQIDSDFNLPLVREARGIILKNCNSNPEVVAWPFTKFGNFGESYCDEIDWSTARVQEKVDGSIMKVWNDAGVWHLSTNACIDAYDAKIGGSRETFGSVASDLVDYSLLDPEYTYIFELTSPLTRVVIDYGSEARLTLLGKRNSKTGEEVIPSEMYWARPKEYPIHSLADCIHAAEALAANENEDEVTAEGYVVVDANFNRIKVKSPAYVALHYSVTKTPSFEDLYNVWRRNERAEFLAYFPSYEEAFEFFDIEYALVEQALTLGKQLATMGYSRKELAAAVANIKYKSFIFSAYNNNDWSAKNIDSERLRRAFHNAWRIAGC